MLHRDTLASSVRTARLLVGVMTCRRNSAREEAVRRTWLRPPLAPGVAVVFVEGGGPSGEPARLVGDRLVLPVPDAYERLPLKSWAFFRWALASSSCEHVLKCDDDAHLDLEVAASLDLREVDCAGMLLETRPSVVSRWHLGRCTDPAFEVPFRGPFPRRFPAGFAYYLSREAATCVAEADEASVSSHVLEDVFVACRLEASPRPLRWRDLSSRVAVKRDVLTARRGTYARHPLKPQALLEAHRIFAARRAAPPKAAPSYRPFARGDVGEVAGLFAVARGDGERGTLGGTEATLLDVFFDAPCQADTPLPSFVAVEEGRIVGFCGTHPRSFRLDGRVVLGASLGQLFVAPEARGRGVGTALVQRFLGAGQQFSFCASAEGATRELLKKLGWANPAEKGRRWSVALRDESLASGPVSSAAAVDVPALDAIEEVYERAFSGLAFRPHFDARHMAWKLGTAARPRDRKLFAGVVESGGRGIGWYVWLHRSDGTGVVIDMVCAPGSEEQVVARLLGQARSTSAGSIGGYVHRPREAEALREAGAELTQRESKLVFHAARDGWRERFPNGPQYVSPFDGEAWIQFSHRPQ